MAPRQESDGIFIHGQGHDPRKIECTVQSALAGLRRNSGAAFGLEISGEQCLVVVQEIEDHEAFTEDEAALDALRKVLRREHDISLHRLILIKPRTIHRTHDGDVDRSLVQQSLLAGMLDVVWEWQPTPAPDVNSDEQENDVDSISSWIATTALAIFGAGAGQLKVDAPLSKIGMDSVQLGDLVQRIETHFRVSLNLFEMPPDISVLKLGMHVRNQLAKMRRHHDVKRLAPGGSPHRADAASPLVDVVQFHELRKQLESFAEGPLANPFFHVHESIARSTTSIGGRELINFASYNYLALSGHPAVSAAAKAAIDEFGTSVSASRLVSGERPLHRKLEREIADLVGTEDCVVFVSGNLTNVTTLAQLVGSGDLVVHDSLAHDSILRGVALSGAGRRSFRHNEWHALDQLLDAVRDDYNRVIIAIEGVYSMEGDIAELPRFIEVKQRHRAFLMVDEAHSIGVLGNEGRGISEYFGIDPADVDIWMGTLSKALASCGGYIAGSRDLVEFLKYSAAGFVFSVGLPPSNAAAALAAIRQMRQEPDRLERLRARARTFLGLARARGLDTGWSRNSPVIPVILGSSNLAIHVSNQMLKRGINVQPIVYPAVEEGTARLRFFICSDHTEEQIRLTVDTLTAVIRECGALN